MKEKGVKKARMEGRGRDEKGGREGGKKGIREGRVEEEEEEEGRKQWTVKEWKRR